MTLYLDASVIVPLLIEEPASDRIRAWLAEQNDPFTTGRFAVGEVASAISRRRRMAELTAEQGERALAALDQWLISSVLVLEHDPRDIAMAAQFVRRPEPKLLMPDAVHLATCYRVGHRLVTDDRNLAAVADVLQIAWVAP